MISPTTLRPLGRTGLHVTPLGLGTAPIGGLFAPVTEADARDLLRAASEAGLRYIDTAPMYGTGRSERLVGDHLRSRDDTVLSTKVGRLMVAPRAGLDLPPAPPKNPFDTGWRNGLPFQEVFDYSHDGILRSFDDSRQRLGLTRIDLLFVHDIGRLTHGDRHDHHWNALTRGGGFRALEALRANGDIRGFGLGVNEGQAILDALNETDPDVCLLAGRYSLIDRAAADGVLDRLLARQIGVVLGGVFNSGILAAPAQAEATFDYIPPPAAILERVRRVRAVCDRHGVPLAAAALQFPLRHPATSSILIGARSAAELRQCLTWAQTPIPPELWGDIDTALATGGAA